MLEIRVGKATYPIVSIARIENSNDFIFVFKSGEKLFGLSTDKRLAPLRFSNGRMMWGNKVVKFI